MNFATTVFQFSDFYTSRLAQRYVTIANPDCLCGNRNVEHRNHQTLPSPRMILKAICAEVSWVWLVKL